MKHSESLFQNADVLNESSWDCDYSEFDYYSEKEKRLRRVVLKRIEVKYPDLFRDYNYDFYNYKQYRITSNVFVGLIHS